MIPHKGEQLRWDKQAALPEGTLEHEQLGGGEDARDQVHPNPLVHSVNRVVQVEEAEGLDKGFGAWGRLQKTLRPFDTQMKAGSNNNDDSIKIKSTRIRSKNRIGMGIHN